MKELQERAKPKKIRVRFPDGTVYCYSSVKETFLATLRKIGPRKLSCVDLEVCRLPMFSRTIYDLYKDFMEPVGDGLYVNIQGDTYNKFAQLKNIDKQLNLGLEIDMSEDFKGERVARGSKGMTVLEVTFPDHTVIGEENTNETFMQCVWHLGIDNVRKLNLKHGGKDLITSAKLYHGQVQVDVNRWLVVPGALKDKVKLLRVMGLMLHIKLDITYFSSNETKPYKKIGSKNARKTADTTKTCDSKFQIGDIVYNDRYGEGEVREFNGETRIYKVQFYMAFKGLREKYQMQYVPEKNLIKYDLSKETAPNKDVNVKNAETAKEHKEKRNQLLADRQTPLEPLKSPRNTKAKVTITHQKRTPQLPFGKFKTGQVVFHRKYGKGRVQKFFQGTRSYRVVLEESYRGRRSFVIDEEDLSSQKQTDTNDKQKLINPLEPTYQVGEKVYCYEHGEGVVWGYDYSNSKLSYIIRLNGKEKMAGRSKILIVDGEKIAPIKY